MQRGGLPSASVSQLRDASTPAAAFLGLPFCTLPFDALAALLAARPAGAAFRYLATPNAQHATQWHRGDAAFVRGLAGAAWLTCDSRILQVLAGRLFGLALPLVTGSDLTAHLFGSVIRPDDAITVIGGDAAMAHALRSRFALSRLALYAPPFGFAGDAAERAKCVAFVRAHPARFVFIACGAPQSELLAAELAEQADLTGTGLCIGAALMFLTGQRARAPRFLQACGLEWLHRLLQEPGRMGPRLVRRQLPVLWIALAAWIAARGTAPADGAAEPSGLSAP
jgi:exopolysaccharide biosynthesis WecB/TagA/CpsF family protein